MMTCSTTFELTIGAHVQELRSATIQMYPLGTDLTLNEVGDVSCFLTYATGFWGIDDRL